MSPLLILSLIFLLIAIGAHHYLKAFQSLLRWMVISAIAGLIAALSYYTALQYFTWIANSLSRLLLPPHQGIGYFAFYVFTEFWADYLLAAAIGFICYLTIRRQATPERPFFYPEEPALCFIAILLVGHPLWILYGTLLLIETLIGTLYARFISKTNNRVSFRYLWLPTAGLILALSPILNKLPLIIYLHF